MVITYYGLSCFKVESGKLTLAFDPPSKESEIKSPRFAADIVFSSHDHPRHNGLKELSGEPFLISGPGEYEVRELMINGLSSFHDEEKGKKRGRNTIYIAEIEDMKICHLGDLGTVELDAETAEAAGEADVLFVPVGGGDVLSPEKAVKVINFLEPKIAIPMHYAIGKTAVRGESVEEFLKEFGAKNVTAEEKFTFKKKDLAEEGTKIVLLKPVISLSA